MKGNKFKDVIIFSFLGLGDFVWATSAISLIKQYDKNIKLTLITFDSFYNLIDSNLVDDNILINSKLFNYKCKIVRYIYKLYWFFKTFFYLYKRETIIFFDISQALGFASKYVYKIKNIIGPNNHQFGFNIKNSASKYYTQIINLPSDKDRLHCMIAYQLIVRSLFPTYNLSIPKLKDTEYLFEKINEKYLKNTKKYKVALCLSGNGKNRYWEINNFVKLMDEIEKIKREVSFFVVGSGEKHLEEAKQLIAKSKNKNIINLINQTSLLEIKELLKNIDLLISVDTGLVHIASVYNKNIICLYGQSLPERSGAVNSNSVRMCSYRECSPCTDGKQLKNKICKNPLCMQDITPEMVMEKIREILNEKK